MYFTTLPFVVTLLVVVVVVLPFVVVDARPFGAANCVPGSRAIAAAAAAHAGSSRNENGSLSDRGTTWTIDGVEAVAVTNTTNTNTNIKTYAAGTSLSWTLQASSLRNGMRGILMRVQRTGGSGSSDSDDNSFTMDSRRLKDNDLCAVFPGVIGLTQRNPLLKRSVSGTMRFDTVGNITVDVTVVYRNTRRVSINGYSQYKFNIV